MENVVTDLVKSVNELSANIFNNLREDKHEKITSEKLREMFQVYDECQEKLKYFRETKVHTQNHQFLCNLIERLYWSQCSDSELIITALKKLYETTKDFASLIFETSFYNKESYRFFTQNLEYEPLDFFFRCTQENKILFENRRMTQYESFNYYTIEKYETWTDKEMFPNVYSSWLKYGMFLHRMATHEVNLSDNINQHYVTLFRHPSEAFLSTYDYGNSDFYEEWDLWMSDLFLLNPDLLPLDEVNLDESDKVHIEVGINIINLLLKDVSQLRMSAMYGLHQPITIQDKINCIRKLEKFVPDIGSRCLEPASLKHTCKLVIRRQLYINWELPTGIFKLNIPESIMSYLNLELT